MRQMLRRGGVLGLLVDQSRRSEGVEVTFFWPQGYRYPGCRISCHTMQLPDFADFLCQRIQRSINHGGEPPARIKTDGEFAIRCTGQHPGHNGCRGKSDSQVSRPMVLGSQNDGKNFILTFTPSIRPAENDVEQKGTTKYEIR